MRNLISVKQLFNYETKFVTHLTKCAVLLSLGVVILLSPFSNESAEAGIDTMPPIILSYSPTGDLGTIPGAIELNYGDETGIREAWLEIDGGATINRAIGGGLGSIRVVYYTSGLQWNTTYHVNGMVIDMGGNSTPVSFSFRSYDVHAPEITAVSPTGNLGSIPGLVEVDYFEPGPDRSGIAGCSLDIDHGATLTPIFGGGWGSWNAVYQVTGLHWNTEYHISGSVSDNAGNATTISYSFIPVNSCSLGKPDLRLFLNNAAWLNYGDYLSRHLTVYFSINNIDSSDAYEVAITSVISQRGVNLLTGTALPYIGGITSGNSEKFYLQYDVPDGIHSFETVISASARDACNGLHSYP